jgi:hypothetical protein
VSGPFFSSSLREFPVFGFRASIARRSRRRGSGDGVLKHEVSSNRCVAWCIRTNVIYVRKGQMFHPGEIIAKNVQQRVDSKVGADCRKDITLTSRQREVRNQAIETFTPDLLQTSPLGTGHQRIPHSADL